MRIREATPERLVIEDRPWILAICLSLLVLGFAGAALFFLTIGDWLGTVVMAFGLFVMTGILAASVQRVIVFLDRPAGVVLIRSRSVFGLTEKSLPLSDLEGAEVQTSRSVEGWHRGTR